MRYARTNAVSSVLCGCLLAATAMFSAAMAQNDRGKNDDAGPATRRPMTLEKVGFFVAGGKLVRPTFENLRRQGSRSGAPPLPLAERDMLVGHAYVEFFIRRRSATETTPFPSSCRIQDGRALFGMARRTEERAGRSISCATVFRATSSSRPALDEPGFRWINTTA